MIFDTHSGKFGAFCTLPSLTRRKCRAFRTGAARTART